MTRPRGFMAGWNPRPTSVALIEKTRAVLADYAAQLPLTIRQIFYRLVGADGYEKPSRPTSDWKSCSTKRAAPG